MHRDQEVAPTRIASRPGGLSYGCRGRRDILVPIRCASSDCSSGSPDPERRSLLLGMHRDQEVSPTGDASRPGGLSYGCRGRRDILVPIRCASSDCSSGSPDPERRSLLLGFPPTRQNASNIPHTRRTVHLRALPGRPASTTARYLSSRHSTADDCRDAPGPDRSRLPRRPANR